MVHGNRFAQKISSPNNLLQAGYFLANEGSVFGRNLPPMLSSTLGTVMYLKCACTFDALKIILSCIDRGISSSKNTARIF